MKSDNETAEVEIDLQLFMQKKQESYRQENEFQNMFQITNDERCNGYWVL
jgi:hypothetical protein